MHSRVKLYMTDSKQKRRHGNFSKMSSYVSYAHKGYIYLLYLKYICTVLYAFQVTVSSQSEQPDLYPIPDVVNRWEWDLAEGCL